MRPDKPQFGARLPVLLLALVLLVGVAPVAAGAGLGGAAAAGETGGPLRAALDGPTATQQNTQITGTVRYEDTDGSMQPARQVDVQIRKETLPTLPNPVIATTTTDDQGRYSISLDVAANENSPGDDDLQIRVQALASSPAVEVLAFKQNFQGGSGRIYHVENRGTVTVGQASATFDMDVTATENRRAFQVTQWALEAREFNQRTVGFTRRQAKVNLNASLYGDRYLAHLDKIKLGAANWDATKNFTVYHEYGHGVQDALWDYEMWTPPKLNTWLHNQEDQWFPCHAPSSETSELYAWYEGFPAFFEAAVFGGPESDRKDLEDFMYFNNSYTDPDCHDGDSSPQPDYDGEKVEGAVANVLWDVYDGKNEPHDDINVSLREIYATISADKIKSSNAHRNTRKVKNLSAFWEQFRTEENHAALGRIYFAAGIQKADKFEPNDRGLSEYKIRHGVTDPARLSNGYPTDGYTWEDGAQQNYGDSEDHYRFPAMAYERVTVTINSTLGNANFDLGVYGPNNGIMGESQSPNSNESVQFRAPKNGRYATGQGYQIRVIDQESDRSAGTYVMNVTVEPSTVYDDDFEENTGLSNAAKLTPDTYYGLKLTDFDSYDTYAVDLDADESLSVEADFDHAKTDIDVFVYGPATTPSNAPVVAKNTSDSDDESLTYHATQSGTHYVKVFDRGLSAKQVSYDLTVETHEQPLATYEDNDRMKYTATDLNSVLKQTAPSGDNVGRVTEGLSPSDTDYYEIDLNSAESFKVRLENTSDARLRIVDAQGTYVDGARSEGETAEVEPSKSGTYYVKVYSHDWITRYDLHVVYGRGATSDKLEPNNDYPSATPATPAIGFQDTSGSVSWTASRGYVLGIDGKVGDEDYFAVDLDSGDDLTATVDYPTVGDLKLELIGESGQTVTGTQLPNKELQATLSASQAGTYYVKVSDETPGGANIRYDLTINKSTGISSNDLGLEIENTIESSDLVTGLVKPLADDSGFAFDLIAPFAVGGGNASAQPCRKADERTYTRTIQQDWDVEGKWGKVRSHQLTRLDPCKVVVTVDAPRKAEADLYVTLDGSRPTPANHDAASTNPGSQEVVILERSDGLAQGAVVKAFGQGYPVAGTYEVKIEIFTPGG